MPANLSKSFRLMETFPDTEQCCSALGLAQCLLPGLFQGTFLGWKGWECQSGHLHLLEVACRQGCQLC